MQCRTISNEFTIRKLPIKLRAARGYFIMEYDRGGNQYKTKSVMVYRLNQLSLQQWIEEAELFVSENNLK